MFSAPEFDDRRDAGRALGARLVSHRSSHPLVLALPRGGVPVAFEVARALDADLDVIIVRKIGAPWQQELGIGAIVDGEKPLVLVDQALAARVGADDAYLEAATRRELAEAARRKRVYRGERPDPVIRGRTVIVVDDGIATGGTMRVALRAVRAQDPSHLILAVPVAPPESIAELAGECDEVVCLAQPSPFFAIGPHYGDFSQTSDDEVVSLLEMVKRQAQPLPGAASP